MFFKNQISNLKLVVMAKAKNRKLPCSVREEVFKGWRVITKNREIILIGKKEKRKLWDVNLKKFVCSWDSFFDSPICEKRAITKPAELVLKPVESMEPEPVET